MALVDLPYFIEFGLPYKANSQGAGGTLSQNHRAASVFNPVKDGNIDKVVFRNKTITGTVTYSCRLETVTVVSGSFMRPSGTLFHANGVSSSPVTITAATQVAQITLNGGVPVTKSDLIAIVLTQTGTGQASMDGIYAAYSIWELASHPVPVNWNGTAWSLVGVDSYCITPGYSDGTYPFLIPFGRANIQEAITSTRQGNRYRFPFACKIGGIWAMASKPSTNCYMQGKIYSDSTAPSGTALAQSRIFQRSESRQSNSFSSVPGSYSRFMMTSPVTIPANTWFKTIVEFETAATGMTLASSTMGDSNLNVPASAKSAMGFGNDVISVIDTANAWVENDQKISMVGPIITAIDDGSGGIRLPMAMNGGYSA